jgi:hypothetical protein
MTACRRIESVSSRAARAEPEVELAMTQRLSNGNPL